MERFDQVAVGGTSCASEVIEIDLFFWQIGSDYHKHLWRMYIYFCFLLYIEYLRGGESGRWRRLSIPNKVRRWAVTSKDTNVCRSSFPSFRLLFFSS